MTRKNMDSYKLESIDILKGIAIIMVILVHSTQRIPNINNTIKIITQYGQMGCQLFFLISGFTLCLSWFKNNNYSKKNIEFYKSRFLNIAPGYYTMIMFYFFMNTILVDILGVGSPVDTRRDIVSIFINFLFLNGLFIQCNNNVVPGGWYIGTSMIFYLFFPVIINFIEYLNHKFNKIITILPYVFLIISIIIQVSVGRITGIISLSNNNSFVYFSILNQFPSILIGIKLYYDYKQSFLQNYNYSISLRKFCMYTVIAFILFHSQIPYIFTIVPLVSSLSFYWLFVLINYHWKNNLVKLKRFIIAYGKVSYSAFFMHILFVYFMPALIVKILNHFNIDFNGTIMYIILIIPMYILTYIFSILFNRLIEKEKYYLKKILGETNYTIKLYRLNR